MLMDAIEELKRGYKNLLERTHARLPLAGAGGDEGHQAREGVLITVILLALVAFLLIVGGIRRAHQRGQRVKLFGKL
jgi:hypothetical protein